jgi:murein L,D-transpeptidase YcbB/YkuD
VAADGWRPNTSGKVDGVPLREVRGALHTMLAGTARPEGVRDDTWRRVKLLYATYREVPLFLEEDGVGDRARALVADVTGATADALNLGAYPLAELREAMNDADGRRPSAEQLARADLLLTATYVALGEDLLTGQLKPSSVSQSWYIDPAVVDVDSALARTLRAPRFDRGLAALRPASDDYARLRQALPRYRQLVARGGWGSVPEGPTLEVGERAPAARLRALAARLDAEGLLGDAAAPPDSATGRAVYDSALAGAVARYQAHHGIVVDSVLGAETVRSMNVPAEYRLGQIAANMERQRWLPHARGARYVLVNVPAFRLDAYENGKPTLSMRVVVGAEYEDRSTPAFADSMSTVVFRPYWNVPDEIAEKEVYPKSAADPDYWSRNHFEEVTENGKTRVRQQPGDDNSLGLVKFLFPNDFAIYLHDTPEDQLFQQDVRAASHGCIRLEKPAELAQWVLGWDAARVHQAMYEGEDDQQVALPHRVPVYIVYFTAYARDGQLYFGNDIYGRDAEIVRAVAAAARPDSATLAAGRTLRALAAD